MYNMIIGMKYNDGVRCVFFLMIRRPPRSTQSRSSAASDVYKRQTKGLRKYQQPILDALGLTPYFTAILTPDTQQALKRDRAFYGDWPARAALTVMVGDYYADDVLPAHSFGFKTVWKPAVLPAELHAMDPFERVARYPYTAEQTVRPAALILSLAEAPAVVQTLELTAKSQNGSSDEA